MENCIEVSHLRKTFGSLEAVKDLSFNVKQGELFGFLGINGAGKSTTINMLSTLLTPTSGKVKIAGYTLGEQNKEIRRSIGVVFQGNTLDELLTIKENLTARAYLYEKDPRKVKAHIERVCQILQIEELMGRRFRDLSGGQKRKCEIARALLNEPKILFLDEPTTGLDPQTRKLVWECIEKLQQETQMTVFLTTHYMEEAVRAEHIAVMDTGEMAAFDTPYALKETYAKDMLKIASEHKEEVVQLLKEEMLKFAVVENRLDIEIPSTVSSIGLLKRMEKYISNFEVVQGTLEDAFLNITGKSMREVQ